MFLAFIFAVAVFGQTGVEICFPEPVHEYVETFDKEVDGRLEKGSLHAWRDSTAGFVLIQYSDDEHREHEDHRGELLDYNRENIYNWEFVDGSVRNCEVRKLTSVMKPVCLVQDANFTRSGTIGEDFKYDLYRSQHGHDDHFHDVEVMVEQGKLTFPFHRYEISDDEGQHHEERSMYFDIKTDAIPAEAFEVPEECPKRHF